MNNQNRIEQFLKRLETQPDLLTKPAFTEALEVLKYTPKTRGEFVIISEEPAKVELVFDDASIKEFNMIIHKIKSEKVITPHSLFKFLDGKGLRLIKK